MTDTNQSAVLAPLEQERLSAELLTLRAQMTEGASSPLARAKASTRALVISDLLTKSKGQAAFDKAKAFYRENLQGKTIDSVIGPVIVNGKGWSKTKFNLKSDPIKAQLVECIVEILTTGAAGARTATSKVRDDKMKAFYFIQKEVRVGDLMVLAGIQVGEDEEGQKYYNISHPGSKQWAGGETLDSVGGEAGALGATWIKPCLAQDTGSESPNYERENQPFSGDIANGLFDSLREKPQLHSDAVETNLADDDLNITIISVRAADAANDDGPAPAATNALATGMQTQKNGSVLVMGDPAALTAYVAANFDASKIKQTPEGIVFAKAQARLAEFVPTTAQTLESGAVVYEHGAMGGGASINYQGETSGVARDLADLKGIMAREWGPEKFRAAFGEDAGADDVKAYQDQQQAIADRKAQNAAAAEDAAAAPERERQQAAEQAAADAAEIEQIRAQRDADDRAEFAKTIGAGVSGNVVYQAYLDTLETLPAFEDGNHAFLGWAGQRVGEFEAKVGGRVSHNRAAYEAYLREYADEHLSERARAARAIPDTAPALTAKGNPIIEEAVLVDLGLVREVFGRWKYRDSVNSPQLFANDRESAIERGSDAYAKADPAQLLTKEQRFDKADADFYADFDGRYGKMSLDQVRQIMEAAKPDEASTLAAYARESDNNGGRRTGPAVITQGARDGAELARQLQRYIAEREAKEPTPDVEPTPVSGDPAPVEPTPEIIEYKTKRDKILRGIIRTDLTLDQAKAIDPYTWKMNGGYFIREKHLGGETAHIQAAPAPVVMTAEQQAEAVAIAARQAAERAQQALATQVDKLRQVANKAIGDADGSLNADRKTNTSKRASEAGAALEKAAANKAAGQTLNRVADAIEAGAGGVLAKLSSRAQLDELQRIMRRAQYDADSKLTYGEQLSRKGRPFDENDLRFVAYPRAEVWSNRFANAAKTMANKAQAGNSRLIAALIKLGDGPERIILNDTTIALTRKAAAVLKTVKESWDLSDPMEAIARVDRLARMGITDRVSLVAAVEALIPHLVEKAQEDPVKKAERAIVGQKVGIDFFPTPAHVAQRMAQLAHIREGMRVLEPSAGNGNLADAAKAEGGVVDVIEISDSLRNILTAKGYTVVAHDFDGFTPEQPYPAILMNPPFSNRQDAAHIMRAFGMLASGGTLVAIAGEGVFFGKDQKAVAFRDWLDANEADVEPLEGGTFKDNTLLAQTGANARLIVLRK